MGEPRQCVHDDVVRKILLTIFTHRQLDFFSGNRVNI
jgi:hypothetical protein